jgi:hypothetical protein
MIRTFAAVSLSACVVSGVLAQSTIYSNIPAPLAGNYTSLGYQATSTSEFGDRINFAGTDRYLLSATVTVSSWARSEDFGGAATFTHPMTLNIYGAGSGATPGALLGTVTQTMTIPFRPTGYAFNGIAANLTFDLSGLGLTAPDSIVFGLAYNTQTYGASPVGVAGPWNSLNFGLNTAAGGGITVGSNDNLDDTMWNTSFAGFYTDGGAGGVGTFRADTGWSGFAPMIEFTAVPVPGAAAALGIGGLAALRRRRR